MHPAMEDFACTRTCIYESHAAPKCMICMCQLLKPQDLTRVTMADCSIHRLPSGSKDSIRSRSSFLLQILPPWQQACMLSTRQDSTVMLQCMNTTATGQHSQHHTLTCTCSLSFADQGHSLVRASWESQTWCLGQTCTWQTLNED